MEIKVGAFLNARTYTKYCSETHVDVSENKHVCVSEKNRHKKRLSLAILILNQEKRRKIIFE
jgi:hypothetical protein